MNLTERRFLKKACMRTEDCTRKAGAFACCTRLLQSVAVEFFFYAVAFVCYGLPTCVVAVAFVFACTCVIAVDFVLYATCSSEQLTRMQRRAYIKINYSAVIAYTAFCMRVEAIVGPRTPERRNLRLGCRLLLIYRYAMQCMLLPRSQGFFSFLKNGLS
jgi:hypothetical protein